MSLCTEISIQLPVYDKHSEQSLSKIIYPTPHPTNTPQKRTPKNAGRSDRWILSQIV
jgi:hypothetical protein